MRHDAQLDLTIIGTEEQTAVVRNETLANFFSVFASNRNVLQVRIARTQSSCGCCGLVKAGVYVASFGVYKLRKGVYISAKELL